MCSCACRTAKHDLRVWFSLFCDSHGWGVRRGLLTPQEEVLEYVRTFKNWYDWRTLISAAWPLRSGEHIDTGVSRSKATLPTDPCCDAHRTANVYSLCSHLVERMFCARLLSPERSVRVDYVVVARLSCPIISRGPMQSDLCFVVGPHAEAWSLALHLCGRSSASVYL